MAMPLAGRRLRGAIRKAKRKRKKSGRAQAKLRARIKKAETKLKDLQKKLSEKRDALRILENWLEMQKGEPVPKDKVFRSVYERKMRELRTNRGNLKDTVRKIEGRIRDLDKIIKKGKKLLGE